MLVPCPPQVYCLPSHLFHLTIRRPPSPTLFPYTTLFRSSRGGGSPTSPGRGLPGTRAPGAAGARSSCTRRRAGRGAGRACRRSEEHTSELQSRLHLVCRLLLEKKKTLTG